MSARVADLSALPTMPILFRDRASRRDGRLHRFEAAVLPHLDSAYDLARWLTRSDAEAEDVVQTACLRALKGFDGFQGANPRAWLFAIVRHAFHDWLRQRSRGHEIADPFDEEIHTQEAGSQGEGPEARLLRQADGRLLREGFAALPLPLREAMVLREIEGLSYKEIAAVAGIPMGTVMSRLARARRQLQDFLIAHGAKEPTP